MLTPQQIREAESEENAHHRRIDETFLHCEESAEAWARWKLACANWHASRRATDFLWENTTRERLRAGDPSTVEDAIVFLETDPWFFRAGYLKERVISALKRAPLPGAPRERLRHVILEVCRGKNRREFRYYCRLAVAVWTREFEEAIRAEAATHDAESKGKYSYLLKYLEERRGIVERNAPPTSAE